MKKREIFKIEGDKITRQRRNCPKCGDGVFLADHKNRLSCGKCGYTEFKGRQEKKKPETPTDEIKTNEEVEKPTDISEPKPKGETTDITTEVEKSD